MNLLMKFCPSDAIVLLVANVLTQIVVVAALAGLLSLGLARHRAAVRHGIWLCALLCVLMSPLAAYVADRAGLSLISLRLPPGAAKRSSAAGVIENQKFNVVDNSRRREPTVDRITSPQPPAPAGGYNVLHEARNPPTQLDVTSAPAPVDPLRALLGLVVVLWAGGLLFLFARLLHGWWQIAGLQRRMQPAAGSRVQAVLPEVRRVLKVETLPRLAILPRGTGVAGPITIGLLRPLVILPESVLDTLDPHGLRDVLVHEFAHALRHDPLVGLLQRLAGIVYWPFPPVHLLNRRLAWAREEVCDNYVLRQGDAPRYGETLLRISETIRSMRIQPAALGLCHPRGRLEQRVAGLLDSRRNVMVRTHRVTLLVLTVLFVTAMVGVAGTRLLRAEPPAAPVTPAPSVASGAVALVQKVQPSDERLEMTVRTSRILTMDQKITQVQVNNPDILDLIPLSSNQIKVAAKAAGATQVKLWGEDKKVFTIDVIVLADAQELTAVPATPSDPKPKVERRDVNKLVKDFPEKIDLSTPESALAAWYQAGARKDGQAYFDVMWLREDTAKDAVEKFEEALKRDPSIPKNFSQVVLETEVLEVLAYRDDLATVIFKQKSRKDPNRTWYGCHYVARINGIWKILDEESGRDDLQSVEAAREKFDQDKDNLWKKFTHVRDEVTRRRGSSASAPVAPKSGDGQPAYDLSHIEPLDVLNIAVLGTILDQPIKGFYLVEPDGQVALGPDYGRADVGGLTIEQAEQKIKQQLNKILGNPDVQVVLAIKQVTPWKKAEFLRVPYTIRPMDVLQVRVTGVLRIAPIDGFFLVESAGTIPLGPAYGRAQVKGLTLEEAEKAIQKKLTEVVKNPEVQVTLPEQTAPSTEQVRWQEVAPPKAPYAISPGDLLSIKVLGTILNQPIDGHYLVEPAGTVPLGPAYGRVAVKGLTLEAAEKAIQKKLAEIIIKPEVQVTLAGWKIDHPMTDHK